MLTSLLALLPIVHTLNDYVFVTEGVTQPPPSGCRAQALRQCYNLLSKYYDKHFVQATDKLWSHDDLVCQMHHVKERCFEINGIDNNCTVGYRGVVASEILSSPLTAYSRQRLPKQVFVALFGHLSWRCKQKQCSRGARNRCWQSLPAWRKQLYQGMILEAHGAWTQLTALTVDQPALQARCRQVHNVIVRVLEHDFCTSYDSAYCICVALNEKNYDNAPCPLICNAYKNMANGGELGKMRLVQEISETSSAPCSCILSLVLFIITCAMLLVI